MTETTVLVSFGCKIAVNISFSPPLSVGVCAGSAPRPPFCYSVYWISIAVLRKLISVFQNLSVFYEGVS